MGPTSVGCHVSVPNPDGSNDPAPPFCDGVPPVPLELQEHQWYLFAFPFSCFLLSFFLSLFLCFCFFPFFFFFFFFFFFSIDVATVDSTFDEEDIPYDVLWLDIEHLNGKRVFTWDMSHFRDHEQMQQNLAQKKKKKKKKIWGKKKKKKKKKKS